MAGGMVSLPEPAPGVPDGSEAVIASHLRKDYAGLTAVADASFSVARGEIFGLLGPNGAGKTTTVECLQGLREASGGAISVLGLDPVRQARELRRRIGCQLQEAALPDHIRVWEALELFASLTPGGRDWRDVMGEWGLADKARSAFHALSGGQRQRLFVALAVVNGPEVVFLDEMTTGLDPAARRIAWGLIREIRERGATVVLVTHFMEEAERLCDRIAVMDRGRVVALDSPRGLIAAHAATLRVVFTTDIDVAFLADVPSVQAVHREGPRVTVEGHDAVLAHVAAALVARGLAPADLRLEAPTLEDVFLALTGHAMAE
jgi:ABC-2 type transport system ATP-binding protein